MVTAQERYTQGTAASRYARTISQQRAIKVAQPVTPEKQRIITQLEMERAKLKLESLRKLIESDPDHYFVGDRKLSKKEYTLQKKNGTWVLEAKKQRVDKNYADTYSPHTLIFKDGKLVREQRYSRSSYKGQGQSNLVEDIEYSNGSRIEKRYDVVGYSSKLKSEKRFKEDELVSQESFKRVDPRIKEAQAKRALREGKISKVEDYDLYKAGYTSTQIKKAKALTMEAQVKEFGAVLVPTKTFLEQEAKVRGMTVQQVKKMYSLKPEARIKEFGVESFSVSQKEMKRIKDFQKFRKYPQYTFVSEEEIERRGGITPVTYVQPEVAKKMEEALVLQEKKMKQLPPVIEFGKKEIKPEKVKALAKSMLRSGGFITPEAVAETGILEVAKRKLEKKQVEMQQKKWETGDMGYERSAQLYGFGATVLSPFETKEKIRKLTYIAAGAAATAGVFTLFAPVAGATAVAGYVGLGAVGLGMGVQAVKGTQERIAEAAFLGTRAKAEELIQIGAEAGAAYLGFKGGEVAIPKVQSFITEMKLRRTGIKKGQLIVKEDLPPEIINRDLSIEIRVTPIESVKGKTYIEARGGRLSRKELLVFKKGKPTYIKPSELPSGDFVLIRGKQTAKITDIQSLQIGTTSKVKLDLTKPTIRARGKQTTKLAQTEYTRVTRGEQLKKLLGSKKVIETGVKGEVTYFLETKSTPEAVYGFRTSQEKIPLRVGGKIMEIETVGTITPITPSTAQTTTMPSVIKKSYKRSWTGSFYEPTPVAGAFQKTPLQIGTKKVITVKTPTGVGKALYVYEGFRTGMVAEVFVRSTPSKVAASAFQVKQKTVIKTAKDIIKETKVEGGIVGGGDQVSILKTEQVTQTKKVSKTKQKQRTKTEQEFVQKLKTKQKQFYEQKYIYTTEPVQAQKQTSLTERLSKVKLGSILASQQKVDLASAQASGQIASLVSSQQPIQAQEFASAQASLLASAQAQAQRQALLQRIDLLQTQRQRTRKAREEPIPKEPIGFIKIPKPKKGTGKKKQTKKEELIQAYDALVKAKQKKLAKGKYKTQGYTKVNKAPLSKKAALGKAMAIADKYANRSITIRKTEGKVKERKDLVAKYNRLKHKFRKAKKKKDLVEMSKFAIDSRMEKKQIPYESIKVRKQRKRAVRFL